jgi:hypothetical protein
LAIQSSSACCDSVFVTQRVLGHRHAGLAEGFARVAKRRQCLGTTKIEALKT